jgi:homospermidine synthase
VGAGGGVGHALLAVLATTDAGRRLAARSEEIVLLDQLASNVELMPAGASWAPSRRITSAGDLVDLERELRVDQVIDLSSLGTMECVAACDALGVSYLTTSIEHWPDAPAGEWSDLITAFLPPFRPGLTGASHLVGSGINPGIVNALVFRGIDTLASAVGVAPSAAALGLRSILITEEDTTTEVGVGELRKTFAMTWSPTHCLEEVLQPHALVVRNGRMEPLDHPPEGAWYRARCGSREIEGMIVPHEEVVTLGKRFPQVEIAFIYRLPPGARRALAAQHERGDVTAWPARKLYPPQTCDLVGRNTVGVLLCTESFGELWIGYEVVAEEALRIGTSATQLQVAAGVVAGWTQLGSVSGIHFVEDLDWREYLAVVDAVLGPPLVIHDRDALPLSLDERRCSLDLSGPAIAHVTGPPHRVAKSSAGGAAEFVS